MLDPDDPERLIFYKKNTHGISINTFVKSPHLTSIEDFKNLVFCWIFRLVFDILENVFFNCRYLRN